MSTGATIEQIKAGLIAAYEAISLPTLGNPTGLGDEMDGNPPSLPYVEVYDNPSQSITQPRDEGSYQVTRRFITRLYIARLDSDTPSLSLANRTLANNCIEAIEDYFYFDAPDLDVNFVLESRIVADTSAMGGTGLFTRANDKYVGVAFQHDITYYRFR
jgi:hypothetical protein